jgi:cysteinyl-tRNA synthetase
LAAAKPSVVRYYLGSAHYRSVLDYHEGVLDEAAAALGRIETFLARAEREGSGTSLSGSVLDSLPAAFIKAMDGDLAIPAALGVLHDTVRDGNSAIDSSDSSAISLAANQVRAMLAALGIDLEESGGSSSGHEHALDQLIQALISERNAARAAKDFARSDAIRDQLKAAGITLEDAADSTHWSVS